jgi:hypothetical protein
VAQAQEAEAQVSEEPREVIGRVFPEVFDEEYVRELMESIKGLSRGYLLDHKCPDCGHREKATVQVPNFKEILQAMTEFMAQGYGRPGIAEGEAGGVSIVVKRVEWPVGDTGNRRDLRAPAGAGSVS